MDNEKKLKPSEDQKYLMFFIFAALFIVLFLTISGVLINHYAKWDRGSYGDMFGLASALFSGLAFAGILITILMQRKELQLQRLDLELTREAQENISKLNALSAELSACNILMEQYHIWKKTGAPSQDQERQYHTYNLKIVEILDEIRKIQL